VIFSDGPLWREHRKFMTKTLRDMGVGKRSMDAHIAQEILVCKGYLRQLCEKAGRHLSPALKISSVP
jgi:hypothetical protein